MSGTRIVHSYSPRKELLRRAIIGFLALVTLVALCLGGLFAFRAVGVTTTHEIPLEERVVRVDVEP